MENTKQQFDILGQWYDDFYIDKNYEKEALYVSNLLKTQSLKSVNLLEFGSGTGKHARQLCDLGHNVHGVELSEAMIAKADKCDAFTCQQGDITNCRTGKTYDAVICLFHVLGYSTTNAQISSIFETAAVHLNKGGVFLFDYWHSPAVNKIGPTVRIKRGKTKNFSYVRIAEPTTFAHNDVVAVKYTLFLKDLKTDQISCHQEIHNMRHFSLPEIELFASHNGFEITYSSVFLGTDLPEETDWNALSVARKLR